MQELRTLSVKLLFCEILLFGVGALYTSLFKPMLKLGLVQLVCLLIILSLKYFFNTPSLITEPKTEKLKAVVVSIPKSSKCYQSFRIKKLNSTQKYLISWYSCDAPIVKPGDIWDFQLKLKPIVNLNNPGGFNFKSWAKHHNIIATAGVIIGEKLGVDNSLNTKFLIAQYKLYKNLKKQELPNNLIVVLGALTLGVKQELTYEIRQWFVLTGTGHLLAISGLHIALIAGFLYFLILIILKPISGFFLLDSTHSIALVISFIILFLYTLLVGAPIPTIRALVMFGLLVLSFLLKRKIFFYYQWWLAAFIVLCFQPLAIFNIGFWFSFLAVLFLYLISVRIIKHFKKWQQYFLSQWLLGFMLLPISLYSFSQFSVSGLLVNLVAIPWVGLIILPLSLLGQLLILLQINFSLLWKMIDILGGRLLAFLSYFSQIKFLVIYHHASFYAMALSFVGVYILIFFKNIKFKLSALLCYIPLFTPVSSVAQGRFRLAALNVGQGLSVVIQTQNHMLVYDTGEKFISGSDMAQRVVLPYLHYLGKNVINLLLVSHGDNDHSGGVQSLIKYSNVKKILTSELNKFNYFEHTDLCLQGQSWQWDGVSFEILYPDKWHYGLRNNSSCVLKITTKNKSVLLTGDIESIAEKNVVNLNSSDKLKSDILIVPHHGSKTSSSSLLLNTVQPRLAIISYGHLNRFHFPSQAVIDRYTSMAVDIKSTEYGAVLD